MKYVVDMICQKAYKLFLMSVLNYYNLCFTVHLKNTPIINSDIVGIQWIKTITMSDCDLSQAYTLGW